MKYYINLRGLVCIYIYVLLVYVWNEFIDVFFNYFLFGYILILGKEKDFELEEFILLLVGYCYVLY